MIGIHEAPRVINFLSNPEPFFAEGPALDERAQLGMAPGEVGTGEHGGQVDLTKAFAAPNTLEGRDGLPQAVNRPTIVTLGVVRMAKLVVRQRVEDDVPAGRGECEGTLASGNGLVKRA